MREHEEAKESESDRDERRKNLVTDREKRGTEGKENRPGEGKGREERGDEGRGGEPLRGDLTLIVSSFTKNLGELFPATASN